MSTRWEKIRWANLNERHCFYANFEHKRHLFVFPFKVAAKAEAWERVQKQENRWKSLVNLARNSSVILFDICKRNRPTDCAWSRQMTSWRGRRRVPNESLRADVEQPAFVTSQATQWRHLTTACQARNSNQMPTRFGRKICRTRGEEEASRMLNARELKPLWAQTFTFEFL